MITLYAHLGHLVPAIAEGKSTAAAGEPLGHVARTGVTYGTHVFFAVLIDGQAVDPLTFLTIPRC
jgi:murein DD-endopeptidase MepM/ murein hydrolase activator NlpD